MAMVNTTLCFPTPPTVLRICLQELPALDRRRYASRMHTTLQTSVRQSALPINLCCQHSNRNFDISSKFKVTWFIPTRQCCTSTLCKSLHGFTFVLSCHQNIRYDHFCHRFLLQITKAGTSCSGFDRPLRQL